METYHKIETVYYRNPETKFKTLLEGRFSLPEFEYLKDSQWQCTEKVDGTNIRISLFDRRKLIIGGRTDRANTPPFLIDKLNSIFNSEKIEKVVSILNNNDFIIFGEGYGEKIQSGGKYCEGNDFVVFDIMVNGKYLDRVNIEEICDSLKLDIAPIIMTCTLLEMIESAKSNPESMWGNFITEGYVARPVCELLSSNGKRIITKIKCKDFK